MVADRCHAGSSTDQPAPNPVSSQEVSGSHVLGMMKNMDFSLYAKGASIKAFSDFLNIPDGRFTQFIKKKTSYS